ncbi:hypothetical protein H8356DRAFT_1307321 [Neocallimastix lanati (nom. inval.)]|uniref:Uncharacterized protein n=1 Tax=Neocallimastix californiae TaxID=1754190 RepID=A0A1Y2FCK2_9FUNG|nr:hypothetical protein H8356DRAFT_1307321 [Neocallimastix sp. JGI-2020a]ORY81144.1 hypothetical protein LY90DRAFT_664358 [Neocallimastix californiae]|eukprot:ORY81144.1 hypothetical protein LY90DRAFT_664358 [Neocallimastix californiae]
MEIDEPLEEIIDDEEINIEQKEKTKINDNMTLENKNKRKRKRKRRSINKILLSKLRSELVNNYDYTNEKFKKKLNFYIIRILQTPKILINTIKDLQVHRLLDIYQDQFLIYDFNNLYNDMSNKTIIDDLLNIVRNRIIEVKNIKTKIQIKSVVSYNHELNKIENIIYGLNEKQYDLVKKLLDGIEIINNILNKILNEMITYKVTNINIDNSIKWMNISKDVSYSDITDLLTKCGIYDNSISSSNSNDNEIIIEDDKINDSNSSPSKFSSSYSRSSGKSSIYSSYSSDNSYSYYRQTIINETLSFKIKKFNQLRQIYSTICQNILF